MIQNLLFGLAAIMIAEGLVYLLAPYAIEAVLNALKSLSISARRKLGALLLLAGLILMLLVT
ncbi:MAG: DUF2065 family protein [Planktomarina sp.]|nr:DUF2065 family protein [Planktomarina sp.]